MGMDLESVAALLGHEDIQMLIQTYGHNVKKETNQEAARLIDEALLKKDDDPTPVIENKSSDINSEKLYKLPDALPPEARQVIERLIATYMPVGSNKNLAE